MSHHGLFCCAKIFQSVFPSRTDGIPVSGRAEANELSGAVQKRENRSGKELPRQDLRTAAFRETVSRKAGSAPEKGNGLLLFFP